MNSLLQIMHIGILVFLLSLFLASASHKLRAPGHFREALVNYQLLPNNLALKLAAVVPFIEIGIVVCAVVAFAMHVTILTTALLGALLLTYLVFLVYAVISGGSLVNCGCSLNGSDANVKPLVLVARNIALFSLLVVFQLSQPSTTGTMSEWLVGITFSLLLFITYSSVDGLLENHALLKNLRLRHD